MKLSCTSFSDKDRIPPEFAFGIPDPESHVNHGGNKNPGFEWGGLPKETKSLVLIAHDSDAPSKADAVNKEGRKVPANLPRVDFFHWLLVDIPADVVAIQAGEFSDGVTPRGKEASTGRRGTRQGVNDYTTWFAGDPDMEGTYFGYDGPCPPWNDTIEHHYHFTLYALDLERCPVGGEFTGPNVLAAIEGHVLDQASITGIYGLNPDLEVDRDEA